MGPEDMTPAGRKKLHNKPAVKAAIEVMVGRLWAEKPDAEFEVYEDGAFGFWQVDAQNACGCDDPSHEADGAHIFAVQFDRDGTPVDLASVS